MGFYKWSSWPKIILDTGLTRHRSSRKKWLWRSSQLSSITTRSVWMKSFSSEHNSNVQTLVGVTPSIKMATHSYTGNWMISGRPGVSSLTSVKKPAKENGMQSTQWHLTKQEEWPSWSIWKPWRLSWESSTSSDFNTYPPSQQKKTKSNIDMWYKWNRFFSVKVFNYFQLYW